MVFSRLDVLFGLLGLFSFIATIAVPANSKQNCSNPNPNSFSVYLVIQFFFLFLCSLLLFTWQLATAKVTYTPAATSDMTWQFAESVDPTWSVTVNERWTKRLKGPRRRLAPLQFQPPRFYPDPPLMETHLMLFLEPQFGARREISLGLGQTDQKLYPK